MGFIYLVRVHRLTPRTLSISFVVAVHPLAWRAVGIVIVPNTA